MILSIAVRKRTRTRHVESLLTFHYESQIFSKQARKAIEASELRCYKNMLKTPEIANMSKQNILIEAKTRRQPITNMGIKEVIIWHNYKKREIGTYGNNWKDLRKKGRERQLEKILGSLLPCKEGLSAHQFGHRRLLRSMIADDNHQAI